MVQYLWVLYYLFLYFFERKQSSITETAAGRGPKQVAEEMLYFYGSKWGKGGQDEGAAGGRHTHSEHFSAGPGPKAVRLCWESVLSTWTAVDYKDSGWVTASLGAVTESTASREQALLTCARQFLFQEGALEGPRWGWEGSIRRHLQGETENSPLSSPGCCHAAKRVPVS